jgi:hypothetical protein
MIEMKCHKVAFRQKSIFFSKWMIPSANQIKQNLTDANRFK